MPPFFSIDIELKNDNQTESYFVDVYNLLFNSGFTYKNVMEWGFEGEMNYPEVLSWNIDRLQKGFRLGFKDHISKGYRQFFMSNPKFNYIRVITSFYGYPKISIIIPEVEIHDDYFVYKKEALDYLIEYCHKLWNSNLIRTIQAHSENGGLIDCERMESGEKPCAFPFAFIEEASFNANTLKDFELKSIKNGFFIKRASIDLN